MKNLFVLAAATVFGAIGETSANNDALKLKYAFEIVRHGARAPMIPDPNFSEYF
jgi:hypothetical protein